MTEQIRISAKNLGDVALPNFCPRCFWVKLKSEFRLPYTIFPGIFSSIDAYTKKVVHGWLDQEKSVPSWLSELGDIVGYKNPPHYSKFKVVDETTNILLRGTADGILVRPDDSHVVVDYKTAKFTNTQDELFPMYATQLNAYARMAENCGFSPVSGIAIIYFEPVTNEVGGENYNDDGFGMDFSSHVVPVDLNTDSIAPLLAMTREIFEEATPPPSHGGCKDCEKLEVVLDML